MRSITFLLLARALLGVLGCTASAGPVLVLEPTTVDFGRQAENKGTYPFTFAVKNGGDQELQIAQVRPGCSCTKVEMKKKTLAPGEATEMTGVLTTRGIEGEVRKGITITSNDPEHPNVSATVAARFPFNGIGLRLQGRTSSARVREGALWAYVSTANCEPETPIQIQAMELPEGWDTTMTLPVIVAPEERKLVVLTRKLEGGVEPSPFDDQPFVLVTDSVKTPRVEGAISYQPVSPAPAVQPPASPAPGPAPAAGSPRARWPLTNAATAVAPAPK